VAMPLFLLSWVCLVLGTLHGQVASMCEMLGQEGFDWFLQDFKGYCSCEHYPCIKCNSEESCSKCES
jgi:hypothetical protein